MKRILTTIKNNGLIANIWAVLGIACAACVIIAGAWWHIATAGICYIMYNVTREGITDEGE